MTKKKPVQKKHFYQRKGFLWPVGSVVALILIVAIAFRVSPWPGAMLIRVVFENSAQKVLVAMEKHTPNKSIVAITNQQYRQNDKDALLDVYYPEGTTTKLPVVIWTHGGAWISGSKDQDTPYFKLLAAEGYTVIGVNYSRGPEKQYPTAIYQMNDAYTYIQNNAERLHADTNKIVLAGDSAGSQISSQMAGMITNPAYAREVGTTPTLRPEQLKGVVLNCGIYNMLRLTTPDPTLPRIIGWGDDVSVWAYVGTKDFEHSKAIKQMSSIEYVTKNFPATYITGGNADPLTNDQSKFMSEKLKSLGVEVTELYYPADHAPALAHEYQFNLDNTDGQNALTDTLAFIKKYTK
jgi:acetyl esterase/lipase